MATAILRSQDCLRDRFPRETLASFPSSSSSSSFQPKHGRNPNRIARSGGRRKRSPSDSESDRSTTSSSSMVVKLPAKKLVMGQVKILKRGEEIDNNIKKEEQSRSVVETKVVKIAEKSKLKEVSDVFSNNRLGPEPEMIPKEIRLADLKSVNSEIFAGSAFVSSPSPNSLPIPSSFTKQVIATKDLRRILGINLL
ncbi:hypothetical protein AQUCO_01600132v1 [Aquilegia coerulea]|uniref:Uncharacterized protein n=1 Tax=Aquilegia coerulea TaxID=218851 RepID=A0A2G5DQA5_AQUCA|nr:hypothetical protein AQUCO_01600132v1 [Aquilegia coerulea]